MIGNFIIILSFITGVSALGQQEEVEIIPIQVKAIRTVETVEPDGSERLVQKLEDFHARNSEGSVYQETYVVDLETGDKKPFVVVIAIAPEDRTYNMNYFAKMIVLRKYQYNIPQSFVGASPSEGNRTETVLGRTCFVGPKMEGGRQTGEIWTDQETGALMYMQSKLTTPEGPVIYTHRAVEFVSGIEPDPGLFAPPEIPEGWSVQEMLR